MAYQSLLNDSPENLLKKYYQKLVESHIPVKELILFGSYAKGTARFDSDLDVCVVSTIFGKNRFDERLKLTRLTRDIDSLIEPHPFHPQDLLDKYDTLAAEIRKYGKRII